MEVRELQRPSGSAVEGPWRFESYSIQVTQLLDVHGSSKATQLMKHSKRISYLTFGYGAQSPYHP